MFPRSLAILLVAFATSSPAAVIIDDFSAGAVTPRREVGQPWIFREPQSGLPTTSVIGGSRTFSLAARDYFHTGATGGVTLDIDTASGELDYINDPGITAVNFEIRYGSVEQPLNANLAMGGNDRLRFGFKWADFEPTEEVAFFDVRVQTKHDTPLGTRGGGASARIPNRATPFVVDVLFKDMQRGAPSALDFSRVVSISFGSGNGILPGDFVLDYVISVPEPTTNAVLGIGAMLIGISLHRGRVPLLAGPAV